MTVRPVVQVSARQSCFTFLGIAHVMKDIFDDYDSPFGNRHPARWALKENILSSDHLPIGVMCAWRLGVDLEHP